MEDTGPIRKFNSSRFGEIEIPEDRLITVPEGIIGFPEQKTFALLDPSKGTSVFLWLHSVDTPNLAFIVTDPHLFEPDYFIDTREPDLNRLGLMDKGSPALFVIVTVPPDDPDGVNANLLAPLLYFETDHTLYQVVLELEEWPIRHKLVQHDGEDSDHAEQEHESSGEVS